MKVISRMLGSSCRPRFVLEQFYNPPWGTITCGIATQGSMDLVLEIGESYVAYYASFIICTSQSDMRE